jgi:hypothetical protein
VISSPMAAIRSDTVPFRGRWHPYPGRSVAKGI